MRLIFKSIIFLLMIMLAYACEGPKKNIAQQSLVKEKEKELPIKNDTSELEETAIKTSEINQNTVLGENSAILLVRFLIDKEDDNRLKKLPNFRIKGQMQIEIDNSPLNIQKDAIHMYKVPSGKYYISSLYSMNDRGEYEFDKPFPNNYFVLEPGKINYIGDIKVRLEEEKKSATIITRRLKLKMPKNNDETIQIIQDKYKEILDKFNLERKIIHYDF